MELVLARLSWKVCLAYLDDVVVFGRTWEETLPKEMSVLQEECCTPWPVITNDEVSKDPDKINFIVH